MNSPVTPSRFIPLNGSINFRDFGGYPTAQGIVKWRQLFRCGSLAMIEAPAHREFAELGISMICDLRRDDEVEMSPSPEHGPFACRRHIPIEPGSSAMLRESLQDPAQCAEDRLRFMTEITREIAANHLAEYRQLFECLLETEGAFLLHCSAGKDRTGFGAALILAALGVDEATIMQDYLLTNEAKSLFDFMGSRMRDFYGDHVDEDSLLAVTGVREEYLAAALAEVKRSYGSMEVYLDEIGVDRRVREALRDRFVSRD